MNLNSWERLSAPHISHWTVLLANSLWMTRSSSTPSRASAPWGRSTPCSPTPTCDPKMKFWQRPPDLIKPTVIGPAGESVWLCRGWRQTCGEKKKKNAAKEPNLTYDVISGITEASGRGEFHPGHVKTTGRDNLWVEFKGLQRLIAVNRGKESEKELIRWMQLWCAIMSVRSDRNTQNRLYFHLFL